MKRLVIIALTVIALAASTVSPAAAKNPNAGNKGRGLDNRPGPLAQKQIKMKERAQELVLTGKATPKGDNKVVKVGKGQYVELAFEGKDDILTILGEFGEQINPAHGGAAGPLHNQIPEPDRSVDNTTIWTEDFNQAYYDSLLYDRGLRPSMANWYLEASSGRYTVDGYVSDWVQVPFNQANYGSNYCGDIVCARTWLFVQDSANAWWASLVAELGSEAAARDWLTSNFDVWDRYDHDGDGNFDERDGYVDHFQSVHAGEGEESCPGEPVTTCPDAIWSHRWYAFFSLIGSAGPTVNGTPVLFGGFQIGNSGIWIGDYTIEPENGGVGVFGHEFGHDLGLPDLYDTSGNVGGAENGTAWWTMWSQGSYGTLDNNGLGTYPVSMTAWERFFLGWLDFDVGVAGDKASFRLGPVERTTKHAQGLFVLLPDKRVTVEIGAPFEGSHFYYSGTANDLDTSMTRAVTLPAGAVSLSAQVRYNIEQDWDYAYLTVNGEEVHTNLSTNTNPNGQNFGEGITGVNSAWTTLTADLSAFAGQTVTLGFRHWNDSFVQGQDPTKPAGFQIDAIAITGQPLDGAESDAGWTFTTNQAPIGFHVSTGEETADYFNAYVVENRQYRDYDLALKHGPYHFVDESTKIWVEHFPYQDGLLIWYWDTSFGFGDNSVGDHPGEGYLLPVDSHPAVENFSNGTTARPRLQSYDATFGLQRTDAFTVHDVVNGTLNVSSKAAVPTFNDSLRQDPSDPTSDSIYWVDGDPGDGRWQAEWNSVNVPNTGTKIRVVSVGVQGAFMQVHIE